MAADAALSQLVGHRGGGAFLRLDLAPRVLAHGPKRGSDRHDVWTGEDEQAAVEDA